jgi:hypothetical protein
MNVGNAIIAYVMQTGNIEPFLELNPNSPVLFTGIDQQAWKRILQHYEKHQVPLTEEFFRDDFPEEIYKFSGESYLAAELLDLARDKQRSYDLAEFVGSIRVRLFSSDDRVTAMCLPGIRCPL